MSDSGVKISKVTVIGAGTMGAQIAGQIAGFGYKVSLLARDPWRFRDNLQTLWTSLNSIGRIPPRAMAEWQKKAEKVVLCQDWKEALGEADLVIEAVAENLDLKRKIFARMDTLTPRHAILSTTSSSIPISRIAPLTSRRDRCLNLHFYQPTMLVNMVDIMGGKETAAEVMEAAQRFIRSIECIPLVVKREITGFPRILHSIYQHALYLWAGGYVDFKGIDRAWMIFTRMERGPFGLMDAVGLDVVYDLLMVYYQESKKSEGSSSPGPEG